MRPSQLFVVTVVVGFTATSAAVNLPHRQCLNSINNMTIVGKTDNHGNLRDPSVSNATAITYDLCVSQCGAGQGPFQWTVFSQQFSSWQLPWLALASSLPFGANDMLDNLESMLITLGSPTLAAYSLALTILNGRWIAQLFSNYKYPNARNAVRILSSLQQSPLRVDTDDVLLASLIMLPQNDKWWTELADSLDYTHTWCISAAASIAWVVIAYVFTIIDYFSQGVQNILNENGQGVGSIGSLWLWLLPIVVGWLQLSPKCDSFRLHQAVERANSIAYVANSTSESQSINAENISEKHAISIELDIQAMDRANSIASVANSTSKSQPIKAESVSEKHAISIKRSELDHIARLDERSTPPIYNYARFLPWVQAVVIVSDTFGIICERDGHHDPVVPGTEWRKRNSDDDAPTTLQVANYSLPRPGSEYLRPRHKWGLDSSALSRMLIASALALTLQWGTTGAAVIIVWFTPTIGLGCRSASYIAYGLLSTLVWLMLLASSILTYYSTNAPTHSFKGHPILPFQARVARQLSIFLRRLGKLIAVLNAFGIIFTGLLQFGSFYDRCYCNSSVLGLGKNAYNVITLVPGDVGGLRAAWIGGFVLAAGVATIFALFVTISINPTLPPE